MLLESHLPAALDETTSLVGERETHITREILKLKQIAH